MKRNTKKVLSLVLVLVMLLGILPAQSVAADDEEFKVLVTLEGLTIGQGFYVEPTVYTLDEINTLLDTVGYGPYTEDTLTAGMAILAMLTDKGLEYTMTGDWESSAYLASVKGVDTGEVDIPSVITEKGGPDNDSHDGNDDEYLGEFDYSFMSGWMCTVNDFLIDVGISQWKFQSGVESGKCEDYGNTYVVRLHFTLWGYGADLGHSSFGDSAYFDRANKDELYIAYANSTDETAKANALTVMENLTATQEEVDAAIEALTPSTETPRTAQDLSATANAVMAKMASTVTEPSFGTSGGEWTVMTLARGGYYKADNAYFSDYYDRIVTYVNETAPTVEANNGALHKNKSTENSRLIIALSSIGKDATKVGKWNLITPYEDFTWITKQGINGPIFALIALDTHNYQTTDTTIRQQCIDYILNKQLSDGGWALSGTASDPDITAMTLQALYPYKSQAKVAAAGESAIAWLSSAQQSTGGYASWGSVNCESIAQVIVALTTWGVNPDTDSRFIKNGTSVVDALMAFYDADSAMFKHVASGKVNNMATDQAAYALVAYERLRNGKASLYNMSDVTFEGPSTVVEGEPKAILAMPAEIKNDIGLTFNATVSIDQWDNDEAYKLIDFVMTVPDGLEVSSVTASSRLTGGSVSYNVDDSGKLRVVYFDANENTTLAVSGTEFPAELFTVTFKVAEEIAAGTKLNIALTGMSLKLTSDSEDENSMVVVSTDASETTASGTVTVVQGISFRAVCLYTGDDVDLIPSTKKAVAVAVTGITAGSKLTYNDGTNEIVFKYSPEITEKTGVSTYVALVDASVAMENFAKKVNYTVASAQADQVTFGDTNGDGVVNAQDALAEVNAWLRVGDELTDDDILTMNVNGDSRINTFDALGVVEAFVNGSDFGVVTKAARLATTN